MACAIWLLTQSPEYKYMFLADLDWAIIPPYLLNQYRIFYKDEKPMASVCWATVNDEVLARLKKLGTRIRPREWNCGEHVVVMGVVAPFGGGEQVLEEVKRTLFAGKVVHMLRDVAGG